MVDILCAQDITALREDAVYRPWDKRFDEDGDPWTMVLVIDIEKNAMPQRVDALEAAAHAVLAIWRDVRARDVWRDQFEAWLSGPFRKMVRRARGARWQAAQALAGVEIVNKSARVLAFAPTEVGLMPKELSRLQMSGTDLVDETEPDAVADRAVVIWLSPHVEMTAGKAMAQVGHAAMLAWWALTDETCAAWENDNFTLAVRDADEQTWDALKDAGLVEVHDAGYTEVETGSCTAIADIRGRL